MATAILPLFFILTTALAQPVGQPKEAALNQEFDIRVGEKVRIEHEGLLVSFHQVAEDSRCPQGVECIWAGNGKVVLTLSKVRKRAATMSLNTGVEPREGSYRGYEVRLVNLNPYPKKDMKIRKRDYVATLIVSRK
jgi:hypothetical protein